MNSHRSEPGKYDELFLKLLEGSISDQELERLEAYFESNPGSRIEYCEFVKIYSAVQIRLNSEIRTEKEIPKNASFDSKVWQAMADHEKEASAVEVEVIHEQSPFELVQKVIYPKSPRQFKKTSLVVALTALAAMLLLIVLIQFVPYSHTRQVATIRDAMQCEIEGVEGDAIGSRLAGRTEPYRLTRGTLSVQFDHGAEVMIEGPAEFEIHTAGKMFLKSGIIYAVVPGVARGFMVDTPSVAVIDLGTEFGIKTDIDGTSDVHLFKGRAAIIPVAGKNAQADSRVMTEQSALRVDTEGMISTISCEPAIFPQAISSKTQMVWRGQSVDLSDIVGGGNGFGTGVSGQWLDVMTGRTGGGWLSKKLSKTGGVCTDYQYHRVEHLAGVDGVFLPNGDKGPIQVTSAGDLWKDAPETKGICFENITNSHVISSGYPHTLTAHGRSYGTRQHPAIAIHPNIGITFDLAKIRSGLPENITGMCFRAGCALSSEAEYYGDADFWVLVDGQTRFSVKRIRAKDGLQDIYVPLTLTDRFLTLVSTDGDLDPASDWAFFAEPRLEIQRQ